jgi:zinc/manganese transport system substrate-binding protein
MADALEAMIQPVVTTTGVPIADVGATIQRYVAELRALDTTIRSTLAPLTNRLLVTNHDALSQFAARYDLDVVGTIIPSMSTSAEASAGDLDALLQIIRESDVRAIFSESTESDQLARALASDLGREILVVELYTESLGAPGSGADSYIGMMTVDADRIAAALSGS